MSPRFLLLAGLVALCCGSLDEASARPRRLVRRPSAVIWEVPQTPAASSKAIAEEKLVQVVYPVADLVVPFPSLPNLNVAPLPGPRIPQADAKNEAVNKKGTRETEIIALLKDSVAPKTWSGNGGSGTVAYFPLGMCFVVSQTADVHEEIEGLFASLRTLLELTVDVEVRMVWAAPAELQKICTDMELVFQEEKAAPASRNEKWVVSAKGKRASTFLDDKQVYRLLDHLQGHPTTYVMQAPKLSLFNGQASPLSITDEGFLLTSIQVSSDGDGLSIEPKNEPFTTGLRLAVCPVVSADHSSVRLEMNGYWSQPAGPTEYQSVQFPLKAGDAMGNEAKRLFQMMLAKPKFSQIRLQQKVNIPDGQTLLLLCGDVPMKATAPECVSIVYWLLTGYPLTVFEDRSVAFLVTPRIVIRNGRELTPVRVHGGVGP